MLSLGDEASAPSPPHELIVHTHSHYFYDGSEPSALGGPVFTAATQPVRPTTLCGSKAEKASFGSGSFVDHLVPTDKTSSALA